MDGMKDYLKWRGDISFLQVPVTPVDGLIFSAISYVDFRGFVPEEPTGFVPLGEVIERLLEEEDLSGKVRVKQDLKLLKEAANSERFSKVKMSNYRNILIAEEETQFAAVTFWMEDGSAFLAFRGTDSTLTGWKEDFNMSFQESVPAQRLALKYTREFCMVNSIPIYLGGHSKGGNLAVYAAAKAEKWMQERIRGVFNQDGPGFTDNLMGNPGYQAIVPKIHTYVPQSSLIGMLLEHEEPYIVIKSNQIGVMQHDPYTWEIMGKDFVHVEEITADSRFLNKTIKNWLAGMTREERDVFVETVFELLAAGTADHTSEIMHPKNVYSYFKTLRSDESMRRLLASELTNLILAAKKE